MKKVYRLDPKVACVNTLQGICEDHKKDLKESDFPKGNAAILSKKGFLIELKPEKVEKVEKVEKAENKK